MIIASNKIIYSEYYASTHTHTHTQFNALQLVRTSSSSCSLSFTEFLWNKRNERREKENRKRRAKKKPPKDDEILWPIYLSIHKKKKEISPTAHNNKLLKPYGWINTCTKKNIHHRISGEVHTHTDNCEHYYLLIY